MTIEKLGDMQIAYMRRTGGYGEGNRQLMEQFKRYLRCFRRIQRSWASLWTIRRRSRRTGRGMTWA